MEIIIVGFIIALGIGLSGVGAGVITAPVLILFLHLPAAEAVGTALIFGAAVKTFAVPVYLWRRQVDFRAIRYMLAGGIPGLLAGSLLLKRLNAGSGSGVVLTVVGVVVVVSASVTLIRFVWKPEEISKNSRYALLAFSATLIGLEVGFSSSGAGMLGTIALMHLTALSAAEVVGTDLMFGFALALLGGGFHFAQGTFSSQIVFKLIGGGMVGGVLGAYLAGVFPQRTLRMALSVWLIWLGSQLCYRGLAVLVHG
ncbi:MAG: sulfite exporter TauE/SafE family protein [Terriglobales bacterium]